MKPRRHKLRITPEALAAFKRARGRELERQGKPVPATLLPTEPAETGTEPKLEPFTAEASR